MDEELQKLRKALDASDAESELTELADAVDAYRGSDAPSEDEHDSLLERLSDAVDRLEATHPEVSTALARIIDSLTAFGL